MRGGIHEETAYEQQLPAWYSSSNVYVLATFQLLSDINPQEAVHLLSCSYLHATFHLFCNIFVYEALQLLSDCHHLLGNN